MTEYYDLIQTILIFIMMGFFKLLTYVGGSQKKLNWKQKFNYFYINIIAGWAIYSALIAYDDWFEDFPQKVFTILSVTYFGFGAIEKLHDKKIIEKIISIFINH